MKRAILCGPNRIISGAILGWCPNYTSPDKCGPLVFTSVDIIMQGRQEPIRLTLEDGAEAFMSKVDDQPHFAYLKELADRQAGVLAQTEATPAS
jgi:hypothetical protein